MNTNKKAILVVSFGTSYKETREKTIDAIENEIKNSFPDYTIYRAFTSNMIIKKLLKTDNLKIFTVKEALEKLIADNVKELIVQPTHVINGIENDLMVETVLKYKDNFESIKIGNPLLTSTLDYENLVKIIIKEFSHLKEKEALVCMGHGSDHYSNSTYPALDYMFKEKGFKNVFVGTVEGYPKLTEVISGLKELNPSKITLMPLMVVAGDHAINDMSSDEEDSWKSILENKGFKVNFSLKGLGEYEDIRKIYIKHIKEAKLKI